MYRFVLMLVLSAILGEAASAQVLATYSGVVRNAQSKPLENVLVTSSGYAEDVLTDEQGTFMLEFTGLPADSLAGDTSSTADAFVPVTFSKDGFTTRTKTIVISEGDSLTGDVIVLNRPSVMYTFSGTVLDSAGSPLTTTDEVFVQGVIVKFHPVEKTSGSTFLVVQGDGTYSGEISEGAYYIHATGLFRADPAYTKVKHWYPDASALDDAEVFNVVSDTSADFTLNIPAVGSISGTVTDLGRGDPVQDAFMFLIGTTEYDSAAYVTDANGNYSIPAFEGEYIIRSKTPGYVDLYYDNVTTFTEATPLSITETNPDITGIDFALFTSEGTSRISGRITDANTGFPVADAEVIAISEQNTIFAARTNANGDYTIDQITDGTYYISASHEMYIPGFYTQGSAVQRWENAGAILLSEGTELNNIDFSLDVLSAEFGGQISGRIISGENSLSGAIVTVYDEEGNKAGGSMSLYDGRYTTGGLQNGIYDIEVSRVGFNSTIHSQKIVVDLYDNSTVKDVRITLTQKTTSLAESQDNNPNTFWLMPNFPNPFNPQTTIPYQLRKAGAVRLTVYDALGREVATLVDAWQQQGTYFKTFDASNLASGLYYYTLETGDYKQTLTMLLVR